MESIPWREEYSSCGDLVAVLYRHIDRQRRYAVCLTESASPASLPDFDIECGHQMSFSTTSDAWLVALTCNVDIPEVPCRFN